MILNKTHLIAFLAGLILGLLVGFFVGKGIYDQPIDGKVERDTVIVTDTINHYLPMPKDSTTIKYITRYLPIVRHDTTEHFVEISTLVHDTVAVEIPITQKHYTAEDYDAWVSGFEPSLDSIKVYREKQYITTTITKMKPPNKWELNVVGGINYNTVRKDYTPHVGGELLYKPNRLQLGIQGGVEYNGDKVEPIVGIKGKIRIF